jgi:uncharacterized protein (TIGR03545 family)
MRRPGLIRWNFFGYLAFALALTFAYLFFGLDGHVKSLMEQKLSALHGGDVHISKAAFRFNGPRIELESVEFNDPTRVDRVQFIVDRLQLDLEWAALLRNRLVILDSQATGVHLNSLQPPEPAVTPGKSLVPPPTSQTLAYASDYLSNPKRSELPPEEAWSAVPSVQAKNGLSSEFQNEVGVWKKALDTLISENHEQTEAIKNTVNQASEKDAESHAKIMIGQLEKSRLELDQLENQVKSEGNALLAKIQTLVELQPHDVTVIRQNVKLPNLEFKNIEAEVGAPQLRPALALVDHFYFKLLPWLEKREQVLLPSYGREQGTEFFFTGRYLPPRLWVKKLEISSKESPDGSLGDVSGRVTDLSSEPNHYPAQMSLQASFKKAEVQNLQLEAQIDHRNNSVDDRLQLNIASYPVRDLNFVKTPSLTMGIAQANANLNLEYLAQKDSAIINVSSALDKVMYRVDSESEGLRKAFEEALAPLTALNMDANAQGRLPAPHWNFKSNLSDRLRTSLQQTLGQEYDEFNGRIKERAYQRVVEARKSLETNLVTESEAIQLRIAEEKEKLKLLTAEYKTSKKVRQ